VIPLFNKSGALPPGIHMASMTEIKNRFACGPTRRNLIKGLELLVRDLKSADCKTLYLDGSFICDTPEPGDYDACWEPEGVSNRINPILREIVMFRKERKQRYGGDIFYRAPETGVDHLEFFQRTRDGNIKGIICIDLENAE